MTGARHGYRHQATLYDDTRSANPSILQPLLAALDGAPGRRLVDVGGGTGNYARTVAAHGWRPVVADVAPAMLERARSKGLAVVGAAVASLTGEATGGCPIIPDSVDSRLCGSYAPVPTLR